MTQPQPRRYRIRVFAPDGEILASRNYHLFLDLTPGTGLRQARAELDALLYRLAAADDPTADPGLYRLVVTDVDTGEQFDWTTR